MIATSQQANRLFRFELRLLHVRFFFLATEYDTLFKALQAHVFLLGHVLIGFNRALFEMVHLDIAAFRI